MKKLILSLSVLLYSLAAMAQDDMYDQGLKPTGNRHMARNRESSCSKTYLDISTGINNNAGGLGIGMDFHVSDNVSLNGGIGLLTTWGYKFYGGGKYFFNSGHKGWAIGGGLTYSTGLSEFKNDMETIYGNTQTVVIKLEPQLNFYAAAYKYWNVGKRSNRMYLQLGLSAPLFQHRFTQLSGAPISDRSASILKTISPGGLIVGLGFSFGLHNGNGK